MNIHPQRFFIRLMDLSSVLLLGARPSWLLLAPVVPAVLRVHYTKLDRAQSRDAFLRPRDEWNRCTAKVILAAARDSCGVEMGKRWIRKSDAPVRVWGCDSWRRSL